MSAAIQHGQKAKIQYVQMGNNPQPPTIDPTISIDNCTISTTPTITLDMGTTNSYTVPITSYTMDVTYDINWNVITQAAQHAAVAAQQMGQSIQQVTTAMGTASGLLGPTAPRGFNRYVNGSDLLEEFIKYLGEQGVRQSEVMSLPIDLFIRWLVIRACEADEVEPNITLELPALPPQPRCLGCQRYLSRNASPPPLHDARCAERYFTRIKKVA